MKRSRTKKGKRLSRVMLMKKNKAEIMGYLGGRSISQLKHLAVSGTK